MRVSSPSLGLRNGTHGSRSLGHHWSRSKSRRWSRPSCGLRSAPGQQLAAHSAELTDVSPSGNCAGGF